MRPPVVDLKRTIAGVRLFADTTDTAKVEKIKAVLDARLKQAKRDSAIRGDDKFMEFLKGFQRK
jgi:hypothetical protein